MMKPFHQQLQKRGVSSIFCISSGKQMNNNYAPCFNKIEFVVIGTYIELPCFE